jgi:L-seryl-tRNA(Ser) seleniumtransferase
MARVINATGVVLHTGLGRAPLPRVAARAAALAGASYTDLEVDRATGKRGRRTARVERMLTAITGAEAALAVNNGAAALLLTLAALANRREVPVSRGELIEIGGEFRLPDILRASGAKLVEVGTTNRTRRTDFERAIGPRTGLLLKVHPSNYRVVGFTGMVPVTALATLAHAHDVPLVHDIGSGLLLRDRSIPEDEPSVTESLADGADLVVCSGDKLLGGPQAGLVLGRADLVERLRRHPIARAVRLDSMTVAAMEAVLRLYVTGRRDEIPLWRILATPQRRLEERARALVKLFPKATVRRSEGAMGAGSVPGHALPSAELVIPMAHPDRLAARLRTGRPPVFCRVEVDALAFDLLAIPPEDDDTLIRAIRYAMGRA